MKKVKIEFIKAYKNDLIRNEFDVAVFALQAFVKLSLEQKVQWNIATLRLGVKQIQRDLMGSYRVLSYGKLRAW